VLKKDIIKACKKNEGSHREGETKGCKKEIRGQTREVIGEGKQLSPNPFLLNIILTRQRKAQAK